MYISQLSITNFRGFRYNSLIDFHEGINVLIGHNNAGKTTILKALELLFDSTKSKRLLTSDFNRDMTIEELKVTPPTIIIQAKLVESENEEDYSEDLVTVSTWLTKIDRPYEALLTYKFFLPEKELEAYQKALNSMETTNIEDYWLEIEQNFIRKYIYKFYIGKPDNKILLEHESINKFDFQFLTAIRDVERDLFTGKNSLLKEVIDFFMDYDIKSNGALTDVEKQTEINDKKKAFTQNAQILITNLKQRMACGQAHMLKYTKATGASIEKVNPTFDGRILDTELYSALKLIVENETGIKIPATNNGLGYNNLIYISLLLAKMQKDASGEYLGSNAKTFSVLAIEEPEAHLHPNMQYKFLKFLKANKQSEVRQIFITSHSPNITSAVDLEDLIVLSHKQGILKVSYPGKVFTDSDEDNESKNYVKRFLDVTKSDMFFAKNIILVEGLAEQLLVPVFAEYMEMELSDNHTSVINIGGRYFNHFLKLFDTSKSIYGLDKKVACITDLDPVYRKKEELDNTTDSSESPWKKCMPLKLNTELELYEYKESSNTTLELYNPQDENSNIRVYTQEKGKSCTFEYDLVLSNITNTKLITQSVSNSTSIIKLMQAQESQQNLSEMLKCIDNRGDFKKNIIEVLEKSEWLEDDKKTHLIASKYLQSISKGVVAQELAYVLSNQITKPVECEERFEFNIPKYIKEAIKWIYQEQ